MTPTELLLAAKAVIADPKHWTQDTYAADNTGEPVPFNDPAATCWCSLGAMRKANARPGAPLGGGWFDPDYNEALTILARVTNDLVSLFNDHPDTTHADVMLAFDKAIAYSKDQP